MSWSFNAIRESDPRFVLVGYGHRLEGRVLAGRMSGELYRGILALEQSAQRHTLTTPWTLSVPRSYRSESNVGQNRRAVLFASATGTTAEILFDNPVPAELLRDLREIFRDKKEKSDEGNQPRRKPSAEDEEGRRPRVGRPGRKRAHVGGQRVQQRNRQQRRKG